MNIPSPEASSRFDGPETLWLFREYRQTFRRGDPIPSLKMLRERVAARRANRHLDGASRQFLTMRQAAFILCRSKSYVRGLLLEGRLVGFYTPAEDSESGWGFWSIPAAAVRALAARGEL